MGEHQVSSQPLVGQSLRECEAGARCGKRLEPEALKIDGGPGIPRVGDDEASAFMKLAKLGASRGEIGHKTTIPEGRYQRPLAPAPPDRPPPPPAFEPRFEPRKMFDMT